MDTPVTTSNGGSASALTTIITLNANEALATRQSFRDYVERMLQVGEAVDSYCPTSVKDDKRSRVKGSPTLEQLEVRIAEAKIDREVVDALGVKSQTAARKAFPWRSQATLSIVRQAFWKYGIDADKAMKAVREHEKDNGVDEGASFRDRVHATFKKVQGPRNAVTTSQVETNTDENAAEGDTDGENVTPDSNGSLIKQVNDAAVLVIANPALIFDDNLKGLLVALAREANERAEQDERDAAAEATPNLESHAPAA